MMGKSILASVVWLIKGTPEYALVAHGNTIGPVVARGKPPRPPAGPAVSGLTALKADPEC